RSTQREAAGAAMARAPARSAAGGAIHRHDLYPLARGLCRARAAAEDPRPGLGGARSCTVGPPRADRGAAGAAVRRADGGPVRAHDAGLGWLGASDCALAAWAAAAEITD